MPEDLPLYPHAATRGSHPFPALERAGGIDLDPCFERFDALLDHAEGASNVGAARGAMGEGKSDLLEIHRRLFEGRAGAGSLRRSSIAGPFPGQDCPEPRFIERSLDNLERWIAADSFAEIHPIEQAALALTRVLDIWPFDYGNRTAGVVFSNHFVTRSGYPPYFVLPEHRDEFDRILADAIRMQTEPLVRAIYRCIERELDRVRG
jgi:hypothetical protein